MGNNFVVLGGWGISPDILTPLFGNDAHYIDSNTLLPQLIENGTLTPDWSDIVASIIRPHLSCRPFLAGWSTGAMLAYGAALHLHPQQLCLISATPSFCRNASWRHGVRPSVLSSMRERLLSAPSEVLADFAKRCGLSCAPIPELAPAAFIDGLHFLEQAQIAPRALPATRIQFFHGESDPIVPAAAGEHFAASCNAIISLLPGTHACFTDTIDTITSIFSTFTEGNNHEQL